jgi:hypothetical protein
MKHYVENDKISSPIKREGNCYYFHRLQVT